LAVKASTTPGMAEPEIDPLVLLMFERLTMANTLNAATVAQRAPVSTKMRCPSVMVLALFSFIADGDGRLG